MYRGVLDNLHAIVYCVNKVYLSIMVPTASVIKHLILIFVHLNYRLLSFLLI